MASSTGEDPVASVTAAVKELYHGATEVILTGVAVIVPMVVTVYVLMILMGFVRGALQPVTTLLEVSGIVPYLEDVGLIVFLIEAGVYTNVIGFLSELIASLVLVALIVAVGMVATTDRGQVLVGYFDLFIESIPGIGTVYKSFRRMGDIVTDDDVDNFQEVKLVELLSAETYVIGFKVGESPENVQMATSEDVVTMFIPFAPNPVTGGFLSYVPESRMVDVDMTVEEGVRNIITSGVAGEGGEHEELPIDDLHDLVHTDAPISDRLLDDPNDESRDDPAPEPADDD